MTTVANGDVAVNRRGGDVDLEAPFGGVKDSGNSYPEAGNASTPP